MNNKTGFRFRLESEIHQRRYYQDSFNSMCTRHGSHEIELPLIVPLDEFVGEPPRPLKRDNLNRVFYGISFQGDTATLGAVRYEGTTPLAHYLAQHELEENPMRFHYFQEMVRLEDSAELSERRQRAFFQLGHERFCVQEKDHLTELSKVIALAIELIISIGVIPKIRLSHIELVKKVLFSPLLNALTRRQLIPLIENGSLDEIRKSMAKGALDPQIAADILELASHRDVPMSKGLAFLQSQGITRAYNEMKTVVGHLAAEGISVDEYLSFDAGIHRSLNFYTGITFQVDAGETREVAGGGDFTGLMEALGVPRKVFSSGFAAGYERLVIAKKQVEYEYKAS